MVGIPSHITLCWLVTLAFGLPSDSDSVGGLALFYMAFGGVTFSRQVGGGGVTMGISHFTHKGSPFQFLVPLTDYPL